MCTAQVYPDALLHASTDRGRRLEDDWPGERGGPRRCLWRNSLTALASSGEPLRVFALPLPLGLGSRLTKRLPRPSATVCYARMIFMGVTTSKWTEKGQKKVGVVIDIV